MTRDEIIDMAREAWCESGNGWATSAWFRDRAEAFETFSKKVEARAASAEAKKHKKLIHDLVMITPGYAGCGDLSRVQRTLDDALRVLGGEMPKTLKTLRGDS